MADAAPDAAAIRAAILRRCAERSAGRTLCPSEIARDLADDWRGLMPAVRAEAAALAREGRVTLTRRGSRVSPDALHGPFRVGLTEPG